MGSCRTYFIENNILTFPSMYIFEVCVFVHKYKYLFVEFQTMGPRATRTQYKFTLHKPSVNLALSSRNSYIMCIRIYNKLPDIFKNNNLNIFKSQVQAWLVQRCFYSINDFLNYDLDDDDFYVF